MKSFLNLFSLILIAALSLFSPSITGSASAGTNWLQFGFNPQHSGLNPDEILISAANAASLKVSFQVKLPEVADGAPVFLSGTSTPQGARDLLFVTTKTGSILALDAHSGTEVWSHLGSPGSCKINNGNNACYTTSSPAIDPNLSYVYSYRLDGYVHKYQVGDGVEIVDAHWPELVSLKPFDEKGSSALSTATAADGTRYLYAASAGYPGDRGDYQGHVTVINLASGAQTVFNAACSSQAVHFAEKPQTPDCPQVQTAVWARPGVVYDPDTNRVYLATGNGTFDPASFGWGDSVLAIRPDGSGINGGPLDSYTPANYQVLDTTDADLGSTAPAILPVPANSKYPHLAVQGGKDARLRLINLDNLSGQGGPGHTGGEIGPLIPVPQGGGVFATPAVWKNPANGGIWVFVTTSGGISGLKVSFDQNGNLTLSPMWNKPQGGTSPALANNLLFYAGSGRIAALDPLSGAQVWSSTAIGAIHWESPIVVSGTVYLTDESGHLTAFVPDLNLAYRIVFPRISR